MLWLLLLLLLLLLWLRLLPNIHLFYFGIFLLNSLTTIMTVSVPV